MKYDCKKAILKECKNFDTKLKYYYATYIHELKLIHFNFLIFSINDICLKFTFL